MIVLERTARSTGTHVYLDDRRHDEGGDPTQPWETVCEAHGGVCSHETRTVAESFLSHPEEWCEDCMHGEGTLAGKEER